jgi:saxitoxin biosynthesis operon SxtJ-like protein
MMPPATHELLERDEPIVGSSDRSFGFVFTVVFAIVGLGPAWNNEPLRPWALVASACFCIAALIAPGMLAPLNRIWLRVALVLQRVVNPIVLAALFYLVVTPWGLVARALGKGMVRDLSPDPSAPTYWIDRAGQRRSRMDQQF